MMGLPTADELAARFVAERERMMELIRHQFGTSGDEGCFFAVTDERGRFKLAPGPAFGATAYRGQSQYHNPCRPTLFRERLSRVERFVERLRVVQFEHALRVHPAVVECSELRVMNAVFDVDFQGLAQHYELKTDLLDFTSDPWIAAFFATTRRNESSGCYEPEPSSGDSGVMYTLNLAFDLSLDGAERSDFVGLQPLRRPGEQLALSYRLGRRDCLNRQRFVIRHHFRHDWRVGQRLLDRFDGGSALYLLQPDPVAELARSIRATRIFGRAAFRDAFARYWTASGVGALENALRRTGIQLVDESVHTISCEDLDRLGQDWLSRRDGFLGRIRYRRACFA